MKRARLVLAVLMVLSAFAAFAALGDAPATPPGKLHRYIMVLKPNTAEADEPDLAKAYGGRALERWKSRRVIEVPLPALEALSRHPRVAYLALVNDGSKTDAPKYVIGSSASPRLASDATTTPPTWDSGPYSYDGSGNIDGIGADTYRYDKAQRLSASTVNGIPMSFQYDSFGNLRQRTMGPDTVVAPTNPRTNQLDHAVYDRAGNQLADPGDVHEYRYDAANMMVRRNQRRYIYTAGGERIGTRINTHHEWEWTIRDFSGRVLAKFESYDAGPLDDWIWTEAYHYRDGGLSSALRAEELALSGNPGRYFHVDHLGTPRLMTNHARQKIAAHDYHPFGRELTPHNQEITDWMYDAIEPVQFTGHERDYTASRDANNHDYLDYMHARYYNPVMGRFLSVDPFLDTEVAMKNPQGWNRYAYVRNNPMNRTDPTGKCEDPGGPGVRICIATFIPMKTFGGFAGDNRGPDPHGGTYRTLQTINLTTPSLRGVLNENFTPGISIFGSKARSSEVASQEVVPTLAGVVAKAEASDGLLHGVAPNLEYNLTLKPTGRGGIAVTGTHTKFPSVEVWKYQDGQRPQLLYYHAAPATNFLQGLIDINRTVKTPPAGACIEGRPPCR